MTTINNNNLEIKSLNDLINIYFSIEYKDNTNELEKFLEFVNAEKQLDNQLELKKLLIPKDLQNSVEFQVEKNHGGDWSTYFATVQAYFDYFTFENLVKCNLLESELFKNATGGEKRKYRNMRKPLIWHAQVLLKLVGRGASKYCSKPLEWEFKFNKIKEKNFLESRSIVGVDGNVIPLSEVTKTAKQQIAEKINIIYTMEQLAIDRDWTWQFITISLDGEFHPNPKFESDTVYNGVSPKESAKILNKGFNASRALMRKRGVKPFEDFFGANTSECHGDAVKHAHCVIFSSKENAQVIRESILETFPNVQKQYNNALAEIRILKKKLSKKIINVDEFNALMKKVKNPVIIEDLTKPRFDKEKDTYVAGKFRSSPVGYSFKYIMKSINAIGEEIDITKINEVDKEGNKYYENDEELTAGLLNGAFRSFNSIRGFNFFGIDSCLTKFRFLARQYKNMPLPETVKAMIEKNDLYCLLKEGVFNELENIYVTHNDNKKFIGCRYNGIDYIKNFYSLAKKNAVDCVENAKNVIISLIEEKSKYGDCYIPTIKEIKESVKLGLKNVENNIPTFKTLANDLFNRISVLVNPNYSSKSEKQKQRLELEMLELSVSPMPEIPEIPGEHKEVLAKIRKNDGKKFMFDCAEIDRLVAIGDNDGLKSYINTI